MLLAMSTSGYVLVIVVCMVVAALLGGGAFSRWGSHLEEHGGRGERIPEPPGFRKPPSDGGLL